MTHFMWFVIRLLLLGLWVGAMAGFAFLFAPAAFAHIGPTPAFAATIAASLRLLTRVGEWCAIAAAAITAFAGLERPRTAAVIVALLAVAVVLSLVVTNVIIPQMETTPLQTPAYDALHHRSSSLYSGVLLAGLVSFVLAARARR